MTPLPTRRGTLLATGAAALLPRAAATQPALPQTVRLVVCYAAGGSTDVTARIVAARLSERLSRNVVVENRPGGATMVGTEAVARAEPDGATVLLATSALTIAPTLVGGGRFDPRRDLAPVGRVLDGPMLLVANPAFAPRTVAEVIAEARARPGTVNLAHPGNGSANHIAAELFRRTAGVDITLVPFNGNAPALNALVRGDVQLALDSLLSSRPLLDGGRVRAVAVTGTSRFASLPDVPTVAESGLPGFESSFWSGLLVPRATPAPLIAALNAALQQVLSEPDVGRRLRELGTEPAGGSPAEFAAVIAADHARWGDVIRAGNLRAD